MMGGMQLKDPHRQLLRGTKLPTVWQKMPIFCKARTLHRSESQRPAEPAVFLQRRSSNPCPCAHEKQVTALGTPCSPRTGRWAVWWAQQAGEVCGSATLKCPRVASTYLWVSRDGTGRCSLPNWRSVSDIRSVSLGWID